MPYPADGCIPDAQRRCGNDNWHGICTLVGSARSAAARRGSCDFVPMDEQQEKPAQMILAYLRRNPGAGDTLEGIVRWWLGLERIESLAAEVVQVLGDLTKQGMIQAHHLANGATFYTANGAPDREASRAGTHDPASPPGAS